MTINEMVNLTALHFGVPVAEVINRTKGYASGFYTVSGDTLQEIIEAAATKTHASIENVVHQITGYIPWWFNQDAPYPTPYQMVVLYNDAPVEDPVTADFKTAPVNFVMQFEPATALPLFGVNLSGDDVADWEATTDTNLGTFTLQYTGTATTSDVSVEVISTENPSLKVTFTATQTTT